MNVIPVLLAASLNAINALVKEYEDSEESLTQFVLNQVKQSTEALAEEVRHQIRELEEKILGLERKSYELDCDNKYLRNQINNHTMSLQLWMTLVPLEALIPDERDRKMFHDACEMRHHIPAIKILRAYKHGDYGHLGLKEAKDLYELRFRKHPVVSETDQGKPTTLGDVMINPEAKA